MDLARAGGRSGKDDIMVVRVAPVPFGRRGTAPEREIRNAVTMTEDLPYRIRRSDRARRVRVSVDAQGAVEVVLPRRSPASAAPAAIEELRPWIERRLRAAGQLRATLAARAGTLPYLGEQLTLTPQPGRTRAHRKGDALLVPAEAGDALAVIERWYRRAAAREIAPRLDAAAAALDASYTTLSIRSQRRCSSQSGQCWRTSAQKRGEWSITRRWHASCQTT